MFILSGKKTTKALLDCDSYWSKLSENKSFGKKYIQKNDRSNSGYTENIIIYKIIFNFLVKKVMFFCIFKIYFYYK